MSIELRSLRQFVTIAELGSYRRAAEALYIAQPALSVSIRKLEEHVGAALFERGARGVTLTPAGEALLPEARRTLFHAEQGRQAARQVALGEEGRLRIGFVGSATYRLLPRCVPAFRRRHPGLRLELSEATTLGVVDMLHNQRVDAGFVRGPLPEDPAIERHPVEVDDLMLAVPSEHALAARAEVGLRECRGETFIGYAAAGVPGLHGVAVSACRAAGFSPEIGQEATQVQTVVSLVASGLGVALVPAAASLYAHPSVRFVPLADAAARRAVALSLVLSAVSPSPGARRLRDFMLDEAAAASGDMMMTTSRQEKETSPS